MPILIAHREGNLCFSIPKLSLGRRLGAFDQMLNESADRITQDGHRYGFLHCLPPVLPSLAAADQQSAAQRLFQKAETGGNAENQIYTMLTAVPLRRLAPATRLIVFNDMIRLGSKLSAKLRTRLADYQVERWLGALDAQHRQHARTQIAGLRPAQVVLAVD